MKLVLAEMQHDVSRSHPVASSSIHSTVSLAVLAEQAAGQYLTEPVNVLTQNSRKVPNIAARGCRDQRTVQ